MIAAYWEIGHILEQRYSLTYLKQRTLDWNVLTDLTKKTGNQHEGTEKVLP